MAARGVKTFISNAGIAGLYTVLARTRRRATDHRGLSMFLVDADAPGSRVKPLEADGAAPAGRGAVRRARRARPPGRGGKGSSSRSPRWTRFRPSVGAAACGLAARALDEALRWAQARRAVRPAARRLPGHAAGAGGDARRAGGGAPARPPRPPAAGPRRGAHGQEVAAAKLFATEAAQRIVDRAVQTPRRPGRDARRTVVERLYREVRALRIYEGTSEIQKLVIARHLIKESR